MGTTKMCFLETKFKNIQKMLLNFNFTHDTTYNILSVQSLMPFVCVLRIIPYVYGVLTFDIFLTLAQDREEWQVLSSKAQPLQQVFSTCGKLMCFLWSTQAYIFHNTVSRCVIKDCFLT